MKDVEEDIATIIPVTRPSGHRPLLMIFLFLVTAMLHSDAGGRFIIIIHC